MNLTKIAEFTTIILVILGIVDRLLKLAAIVHFFNRSQPPLPSEWPTVALIQPITRGATNLEYNLHARCNLDYPAEIHHILVCDAADAEFLSLCYRLRDEYPSHKISILKVESEEGAIASKIKKIKVALEIAENEILCFIDDDIAPKPDALKQMIPYLLQPEVGATFGLACAGSWNTVWSSLMSAFVNLNALMSYIPITYFTEPFTITGHIFAITRNNFNACGGLENMAGRSDDDHELGRRLNAINLKLVQTPVIYKIFNEFFSWGEYANQMKRWFVFPRQMMIPYLSSKQKLISYSLSLGLFIPSAVVILTLLFPSPITGLGLLAILITYLGVYAVCAIAYLKPAMPLARSPILLVAVAIAPLQILWALLGDNNIVWRGQKFRVNKGGYLEEIE